MTARGRSRREQVRLEAAEMFAQDADARQVARFLRVSTKSVYQWRRAWRAGGDAALASKGPGGNACKLDEAQLARLSTALDVGPAACGWDTDQRWTLARAAAMGAWICFEDESGQALQPPKARTWGHRGHTPWSGSPAAGPAGSRSPGWPA
jgi:transposase